ncbi:MAG: MFS transporter [Promethearchaeota archaeon]
MLNKEEKIPEKSKVFIEFIIYLIFALGPLTGNVILVLYRILSIEFSVNPNDILIAIPSFMFPFAITQLFSGAISDIKGRIQVILIGLFTFGIGMTIATISFSLIMYLIANILGGIGFGFVNPVLIALLTDLSSGPTIPKKMGYLGAVANLGVGFGPILAGQLVIFSWRYLYLIFMLITAFAFVTLLILRKTPLKSNQKTTIGLFFKQISEEIRRKVVILMIFSAFLISQTYLAIITWISRELNHLIPENLAGIVIGSAGITGAVAGVLIGKIIKTKGVKIAIIAGLISLYLSILVLLVVDNVELLFFTTIGLILTGATGGILIPSMMYYSQVLSKERRGALAGLLTAGQFIGIALVPIIYNWFYIHGGIHEVYFMVLIVSFPLVLIIVFLYIFAKKS